MKPKMVRQTLKHVTPEIRTAAHNLIQILYGIKVKDLIKYAITVADSCGEEAEIEIIVDDYWGSDVSVLWDRFETKEEREKREASDKKREEKRKETLKLKKEKQIEKDLKELARLKEKYE